MKLRCFIGICLSAVVTLVAMAGEHEKSRETKPAIVPVAWPQSWKVVYRRIESLQNSFVETLSLGSGAMDNTDFRRIQQTGNWFYQNGILHHSVSAFERSEFVQGEPVELVICRRSPSGSQAGYLCLPPVVRLSGKLDARGEFSEDVKIAVLTQPEENHWPDAMEIATQNYMSAYEDRDHNPAESATVGIDVKEHYKVELWEKEKAITPYAVSKYKSSYEPRKFVPADGIRVRVSSPTADYHSLVNWHIFRNGKLHRKLPVSGNEFVPLPEEVGQYVVMIIASAPDGGLRVSNYSFWKMLD
jgi:hypothetical protein